MTFCIVKNWTFTVLRKLKLCIISIFSDQAKSRSQIRQWGFENPRKIDYHDWSSLNYSVPAATTGGLS